MFNFKLAESVYSDFFNYCIYGLSTVDLDKDKESVVVAKGGSGGNSKNNFLGLRGQSNTVGFELKLLADVGLVG